MIDKNQSGSKRECPCRFQKITVSIVHTITVSNLNRASGIYKMLCFRGLMYEVWTQGVNWWILKLNCISIILIILTPISTFLPHSLTATLDPLTSFLSFCAGGSKALERSAIFWWESKMTSVQRLNEQNSKGQFKLDIFATLIKIS